MAKDTEKLIRQLSLISYLMAERRPVTAPGDPARRRGLQRDERGRVRAPLLRRPLRARGAGDRPLGREAGRRPGRAGDLLAAARELPPARDRVHRQGAGRAAHRAAAARRRVRLRRAAAAGAPADLLGPPEPAHRARAAHGRARDHRLGRRPRRLPAAGQDRDGDLPPQDDRVRLLHDGARRARRAPRRPLPAALPGRPVLPRRPRRTSATRSGSSACPGSAARSATRPRPSTTSSAPPTSIRAPTRTGSTGSSATRSGTAEVWIRAPDRLADRAPLRPLRRDAPGEERRRPRVRHALRQRPPADRLGARAGRARADPRPARAGRRAARARRAAGRAPHGRAPDRRRGLPARATAPTRDRPPPGRTVDTEQRPPSRGRDPPRAVRPPGDAGQHPDRGRARRAPLRRRRARASASRSQSRSCARTSRC